MAGGYAMVSCYGLCKVKWGGLLDGCARLALLSYLMGAQGWSR